MFRRVVRVCLLIGALGNATPSLAEVQIQVTNAAFIEDDLVGSGYEAPAEQPRRQAIKRLGCKRGGFLTDIATSVLEAVRDELLHREPNLGGALAAALPRIYRDDAVGTMIRSGNSIRFNQTYVLSLSPQQLLDHMWQLAVSLHSPY